MDFIEEGELEFNDPPRLVWIRVKDAKGLLWRENPKLHDLQAIVKSVRKHAFQVPPKFDAHLHRIGQAQGEEPLGAIKAGNGRIEALSWMEDHSEDLPRGLARHTDGSWVMPLLVGTDARSGVLAQAYAIDDNNLVLSGADFDSFEMSRLWGPGYIELLQELDDPPVTVDRAMLKGLKRFVLEGEEKEEVYTRKVESPVYEPSGKKPVIGALYDNSRAQELIQVVNSQKGITEAEKLFLTLAAYRHVVFSFDKIADYYAHSDPEMQSLMEDSALVILDFNRAIELGFVQLTEQIRRLAEKEIG